MQFLSPGLLWALLALAIPIIIHLFYFRRYKKVYFSNVKFLKDVQEESSSRSRLRNFLVLLTRLSVFACLVFAFAQPFVAKNNQASLAGNRVVSVFIDNSFSMTATDQDVPLLEKAKLKAREIISAYGDVDEIQVLTHDFEGRDQRMISKDDALNRVDEVQVSAAVHPLSQVLDRLSAAQNMTTSENRNIFILSDFQKSIADLPEWKDTTTSIYLIPLQSNQEQNITIDSVWLSTPVPIYNQANQLLVKVYNYSSQDAEDIRLSLDYSGQLKPVGSLNIPAGSFVIDTVEFLIRQTGWQTATLSIADYPVQFDDTYYLTFLVNEQLNVLSISSTGSNKYLKSALQQHVNFKQASDKQIDYSSLAQNALIILDDLPTLSSGLITELTNYIHDGGNVLVFPPQNANLNEYNSFLGQLHASRMSNWESTNRQVYKINTDDFVFNQVYTKLSDNIKQPSTTGNFNLLSSGPNTSSDLLTYRDGRPFINKTRDEDGYLYLCAAPLNVKNNDLVKHAEIFVPMLYKMAISSGKNTQLAYTIGEDQVIEAINPGGNSEEVLKLGNKDIEFIPGSRTLGRRLLLTLGNFINEDGFFNLYRQPEEVLGTYALNFNRRESNLALTAPNDLNKLGQGYDLLHNADVADMSATVAEIDRGHSYWRYLIIAALLFLLLETLLLRLWKV